MRNLLIINIFFTLLTGTCPADGQVKIAKLKYGGGGDWYANKTALPNLIRFCNQELGTHLQAEEDVVEVGNTDLFSYPFVYMTGHGNVVFTATDAQNLRQYLVGGGFLHIDDNYGMDPFVRVELKKVFPELELVELPLLIPSITRSLISRAGCPKYMSMTANRHKGSA